MFCDVENNSTKSVNYFNELKIPKIHTVWFIRTTYISFYNQIELRKLRLFWQNEIKVYWEVGKFRLTKNDVRRFDWSYDFYEPKPLTINNRKCERVKVLVEPGKG